jgi:putative ABC transport system permease protein
LMVQSFVRVMKVDTGFRTDHLLTAEMSLSKPRYPSEDAQRLFVQHLLEALNAEPQFSQVAIANGSMMTGNESIMSFDPAAMGFHEKTTTLESKSVSPGFFKTMGIPLVAGRWFDERDTQGTPQVAVINQSLARRFFPEQNPLGKTLKFSPAPDDQFQIVGVVTDTRDIELGMKARLQVYFALLQSRQGPLHLMVRSSGDPLTLAKLLQQRVWSVDKDQPLTKVRSMTQVIAESEAEPRFRTWLLSSFAAAGLSLTLIGIYGVISYSVSQRTRELGIRIALGAQRKDVRRLVLQQGFRLALIGALIGMLGSLGLMRLLARQLYEIKPSDPVTLVGAAMLILAVSLCASYIPSWRATKVDPIVALRHE